MKQYDGIKDEELISRFENGESEILDYLMEKYKNMVRKKARTMFLIGGENDDLIQEGMIGLFKAITSYQEGKSTSFSTFAYLCVHRQIYTTITAFNRKKHIPLNTSISLFEYKDQGNEFALDEILENPDETPEESLLRKEEIKDYYQKINQKLSKFEKQVMYYYLNGDNYTVIAKKLGKTDKSIDNAIQRIRKKIKSDERK